MKKKNYKNITSSESKHEFLYNDIVSVPVKSNAEQLHLLSGRCPANRPEHADPPYQDELQQDQDC